ncbi:MAG: hypothetical protein V2G48_03460 [bacterium JZ-2024 1]
MAKEPGKREWEDAFLLDPKEYPISLILPPLLTRAISCDFSVGYCFPAGMKLFTHTLPYARKIRLLLGRPTEKEEAVLKKPDERRGFLARTEETPTPDKELENIFQALPPDVLQDFYDLLASGILEVRYYEAGGYFFHRFYILHLAPETVDGEESHLAFYGTGNFSLTGITDPLEANFVTTSANHIARLKAWFEQKWKESSDKHSYLMNLLPALYEKKAGKSISAPAYIYLVDVPEKSFAGEPLEIDLIWNRLSHVEVELVKEGYVENVKVSESQVPTSEGKTQVLPAVPIGTAYVRARGKVSERRSLYTPFYRIQFEERKPEVYTSSDLFAFLLIFWGGEKVGELLRSFAAPPRIHPKSGKVWKEVQMDRLYRMLEIHQHHNCGIFLDGIFLSPSVMFSEMLSRLREMGKKVEPVLVLCHPLNQQMWKDHLEEYSPIVVHYQDFYQRMPLPSEANRARFIIVEEPPGQDWYPALARFLASFPGVPVWLALCTPFYHPAWHSPNPLSLISHVSPYPAIQKISSLTMGADFFTGRKEEQEYAIHMLEMLLEELACIATPKDASASYSEEYHYPSLQFHYHTYEWTDEIPPLVDYLMRYFSEDSIERLTLTALNLLGYKFKKTPEEQKRVREYPTLFPLLLSRILMRLESGSEALFSMFAAHKKLFESLEAFLREPKKNIDAVSRALLQPSLDLPRTFTDLILDTAIKIAENPTAFSIRKMRADLEWDLKVITELVQKLQAGTKSYFASRYQLLTSLLKEIGGEKTLLVSRYPETVEEIGKQLREDNFPAVGICSDPFTDVEEALPRFAPLGYGTGRDVLERKGEIHTLVILDSLPPGLPLWDAYALIFLDYPVSPYTVWRQIRRVFHTESPHSSIQVYFLAPGKHRAALLKLLEESVLRIYTLTKDFRYVDPEWLTLREWASLIESFPLDEKSLYAHLSFSEYLQIHLRKVLKERPGIRLRARQLMQSLPAVFESPALARTALFYFAPSGFVVHSELGYTHNSQKVLEILQRLQAGGELKQVPIPEKAVEKARQWYAESVRYITSREITPQFMLGIVSPDYTGG